MKPTTFPAVKQALHLLSQAEDDLLQTVGTAPVAELIAVGQRLWWIVDRANKILDLIKVRLRQEAAGTPGSSRFDSLPGDSAHALVVPQASSLNVRKDADVSGLATLLGDRFPEFFETVTTYRPRKDFQVRVASSPAAEQGALLEAVEMVDRTPRVVFKD